MALDITVNVTGAVVQPGDTLVLAMPYACTRSEIDEMRARLGDVLPGVHVVVVVAADLVVHRK